MTNTCKLPDDSKTVIEEMGRMVVLERGGDG